MKIIGILLLALGSIVTAVGAGAAVINFGNQDPAGQCTSADRAQKRAHDAVDRFEATKGTAVERQSKAEAEDYLAAARIAEAGCAELIGRYRTYGIVSAAAAIVGAALFIVGCVMLIYGLRKKRSGYNDARAGA